MAKFNKDVAKKVSLQTVSGGDGPSDGQGIEIKSPGKMHWFTIKGQSYENLIEVQTVALHDPDGELLDYVVQTEDPGLREKIFNKADDNNSTKLILRCCNWFGTEFLWTPSIATKLSKQSIFKALERNDRTEEALKIYKKSRPNYHSVTANTIDELLGYEAK